MVREPGSWKPNDRGAGEQKSVEPLLGDGSLDAWVLASMPDPVEDPRETESLEDWEG
jgi:hypothetical protein